MRKGYIMTYAASFQMIIKKYFLGTSLPKLDQKGMDSLQTSITRNAIKQFKDVPSAWKGEISRWVKKLLWERKDLSLNF